MIFIRVDANEQIATGHMMRCKTIAHELIRAGRNVEFLVSDQNSEMLLSNEDLHCHVLNARWDNLGTDQELHDMKRILSESLEDEGEIPVLLVDSYYVTNKYFQDLRIYAKTAYIDDLAEETYDVDVLINYNITYENYDYYNRYKGRSTRLILGPEYVPLRRQFEQHKTADQLRIIGRKTRVLIMCGGGDTENVLYTMLEYLSKLDSFEEYQYVLVAGSYNPNIDRINELASRYSNVDIMVSVDDIASVMLDCDIAITTASTVLYECCAIGIPTAVFTVADNQLPDAEVFHDKYGLIYLGDVRSGRDAVFERASEEIEKLSSDLDLRANMSDSMKQIVDGKGAQRIANLLLRIFETGSFFEADMTTPTQNQINQIDDNSDSAGGGGGCLGMMDVQRSDGQHREYWKE